MAARSTFSTSGATPFLVKATVSSASPTRRPLISSSTRRAFCGDTRWNFASARNSCVSSCIGFFLKLRLAGLGGRLGRFCRVTLKRPRGGKLAQLVSHHVLRHIDRNKLSAVVHRDGVAHHIRVNSRAARPGTKD